MLVWLLLLAIAFQGIAAAGMLACTHAAMPHGGVTAVAAMSAQQQIDAGAGHCHDAGPQVSTHAAGSGTAMDHAPTAHEKEHCSACAACCIGAAMAGAPTLPAAPPTLSTRLIDAPTGRPEAVDLALPERPPRFPLA